MGQKPTYKELEQKVKDLGEILNRRTERAEAEQQKLQAQLSNSIEMAHLGPWEYDALNDLFTFNDYFYKMFHTTADDVGGYVMTSDEYARRFLHPDDVHLVGEEVKKAIKTKDPDYFLQMEHRIIYADGAVGHISVRFFIVKDESGRTIRTYGVNQDITDRKLSEEELKQSEETFRAIFNNAGVGITLADKNMKLTMVNDRFSEMLGMSKDELYRISISDIVPLEERILVQKRLRTFIQGKSDFYRLERRLIRKDGNIIWVDLSISPIHDKNGNIVGSIGVNIDITERVKSEEMSKKLEERLRQTQKMEAIGTLAGGLAHDYNNLLMGILGNASLILLDMEPTNPFYDKLKNIEHYVQMGADLTKQMLGFARGGKYEIKPTDMNELLKKSADMFGRTRKEITIHTEYQKDIWIVEVDQGQINQVLLNLFVNAWQSMPGGGELYLETQNVIFDDIQIKPFYVVPGKYVKVSVTDTGTGMDEATRKRIFEPFFTTKEMGRDTGLGLASSYGIIKNHSGIINVYSEPGEGTTFNLYLPVTDKVITKELKMPDGILKGNETILIVDDEDMIINIGGQLLKELGYDVLTAKTGEEALDIYRKNKEKIGLVILDMIMPNMGGGATYDELKKINPYVKVLLSSGYSMNGQASMIMKKGCNGFIQKPFGIIDMSHKIREILDKE